MAGGYFQGQMCTHSRSLVLRLDRFVAALRVKSGFQTGVCHLCRLRLCGQDTCPLCLLSGRLSLPVSNTLVTHTICSLRHSWLGQTWRGVGNGADATCDLDALMCERGGKDGSLSDFTFKRYRSARCLETCLSRRVIRDAGRSRPPPSSCSTLKISVASPHATRLSFDTCKDVKFHSTIISDRCRSLGTSPF